MTTYVNITVARSFEMAADNARLMKASKTDNDSAMGTDTNPAAIGRLRLLGWDLSADTSIESLSK